MCGILGGNIRGWDYARGVERIRHRGPDCQRVTKYEDCTLGFARLSIMDLSETAMQPLESQDGNVVILFNGEIYGFQNLRSKLTKKYAFRTLSDTEVVLYAYMEYGDKFIDYIDGMFAIAIYDKRIRQMKLYRDRYGIKPLYYLYRKNQFAFTSELKAFLAASENFNEFVIDKTAIYDYLAYQYIPEPKTMYKDIYKLEPASYVHFDLETKKVVKKGKYWKLKVCTKARGKRKRQDVLDDIRQLIANSVKKQIVADVPVGTFLSGGVDSSIITYECSRFYESLKSFSIGFKENAYDESKYAKMAAEKCHIENILDVLSNDDISKTDGLLRELYDEPFADTSAYPTYIVSKLARKSVKVVLTGDGGDEVFGGYARYHWFMNQRRKGCNIFSGIHIGCAGADKRLSAGTEDDLTIYCRFMGYFDKNIYRTWRKKLGIPDDYDEKWFLRKYDHKELPAMTRMRYLDFKTYLPGDVLTKVDRATMSVSLEARVPFLDRELVEYMFSLAENEYYYQAELKTLLKKAYEDVFPKEILYRDKKGFAIPESYIAHGRNTVYEKLLKLEWAQLCESL